MATKMKHTFKRLVIIASMLFICGGTLGFARADKVVDKDLLTQEMNSPIWIFQVTTDGNQAFVRCMTGGRFTCLSPFN